MAEFFKLLYTPEALESISKLSGGLKKIAERVLLQIATEPQVGKRLTGKFKGIYSERVTRRYLVLYLVNHPKKEVVVLDLKHRKEVYE